MQSNKEVSFHETVRLRFIKIEVELEVSIAQDPPIGEDHTFDLTIGYIRWKKKLRTIFINHNILDNRV